VVNRLIAHEPRLESHKSSVTISAPTSTPVLGGPCSLDGNGFDPRPADDRQIRAQPNARAVNGPPPAPPPTGTRATNPAPSTPATPPRTAAPPPHPLGAQRHIRETDLEGPPSPSSREASNQRRVYCRFYLLPLSGVGRAEQLGRDGCRKLVPGMRAWFPALTATKTVGAAVRSTPPIMVIGQRPSEGSERPNIARQVHTDQVPVGLQQPRGVPFLESSGQGLDLMGRQPARRPWGELEDDGPISGRLCRRLRPRGTTPRGRRT
jgi:hypothetical protein